MAVTLASSRPLAAAVLNVDTVIDDPALTGCDDAAPNDCSLRGAIIKANGLAGTNTIDVPAGTYVLSRSAACSFADPLQGTFLFPTTSLCLTGKVTLVGAGSAATIIDGNHPLGTSGVAAPVMWVSAGATVELKNVSLIRGNFSTSSFAGYGGGIRNAGTLTLVDGMVSDSATIAHGGGIYNTGHLSLIGGVVARNSADGAGGGIANFSGGFVSVAKTIVRDNFSGAGGGGIENFAGTVTIDGSTIAGNTAHNGVGGGLHNAPFNTTVVTNSTLSGNRARSGGGIFNDQASATLYLNNVTITSNTARWFDDPTRGIGGGLVNLDNGVVSLRNTLIARNIAAETDPATGMLLGPDCFAFAPRSSALTSQGYNLIQDTSHCDIAGSVTGNVVGQDPKLGALADNGGPTLTHALGAGSPAIDAGSPAPPGSGGTACAATDQRQFLRPLGSRCDIGAVERSGAFNIARIAPAAGGNAGSSAVVVVGSGFANGASVVLRSSGQPDIAATAAVVDVGGGAIAASFDLTGKTAGARDVVVVNPDQTSRTLAGAFTVEAGGAPSLWVDAIGAIRGHGHPNTITFLYGNRGNVDAIGVPLSLSLPQGYAVRRAFAFTSPPAQSGQPQLDWTFVPPIVADSERSFLQVPLLLPVVPAGFTGVLRIQFTFPENAPSSFTLATISDPFFTGGIDAQLVADTVAGAQAYVLQNFGLAVPASVLPAVQQYVTNQLNAVIVDGRAAFIESLGSNPQIYSLAQLKLDVALYAALRASGSTESAFRGRAVP